MRCALPIRLSHHPGLVEGSIFSRQGVLPTVPSEIFCEGQVKATESHMTTAHFWAINEFTYSLLLFGVSLHDLKIIALMGGVSARWSL